MIIPFDKIKIMAKINIKQIKEKLTEVLDPELNISIVDLGLIYETKQLKNYKISILMTLTSMGCPLISTIEQEIKNKLGELGIPENKIEVKLTFDPPWTMDMMSKRAKAMLGI